MTDLWRVLLILINGPIISLSMLINGPMAGAANTNEWAHDRPMASAADTNKWAHYIFVNAHK